LKILILANTGWYLRHFRLPLAMAARDLGHEVVLACPNDADVSRLEQAGFRWVEVKLSRQGMNPLAEIVSLWRLVRLYRQEQPDLVHHFTIKCVLYGSIAARLAGVHAVVNAITGMGYAFSGKSVAARFAGFWASLLYRLALGGTQVIFQNPDDCAAFVKRGFIQPDSGFLIRGSGVDVAQFKPCAEFAQARTLTVLLASRLLWSKGVGEYVAAAARVRRQLPDVAFLLAGVPDAGNPDSILPSVLLQWEAEGAVTPLGQREDMAELMRQVDLLVLPSRYGEGVPRCLIEGAASGLALVASDTPGCREIVQDGVNGRLVPPGDVEGLAQAILSLLQDDKLRTEMGEKSRQLACEGFSEEQVITRTLQVYQMALSSGSAGQSC
jgi:glycosyltransferase involved in cell wall biosynthesis